MAATGGFLRPVPIPPPPNGPPCDKIESRALETLEDPTSTLPLGDGAGGLFDFGANVCAALSTCAALVGPNNKNYFLCSF